MDVLKNNYARSNFVAAASSLSINLNTSSHYFFMVYYTRTCLAAFSCAWLVLLGACNKKEPEPVPVIVAPQNEVVFTLDGTEHRKTIASNRIYYTTSALSFYAQTDFADQQISVLIPNPITVGIARNATITFTTGPTGWSSDPYWMGSGTVVVDQFDMANRSISGTFSGTLGPVTSGGGIPASGTKSVTFGKFTNIKF